MAYETGLIGTASIVVSKDDTAIAITTGDVPVLATPRIVELFERAAIDAINAELSEATSTVGHGVQIEHVNPSAVGNSVYAEATLDKVDGRRLHFKVSAKDQRGLVAVGRITRVIVNVERFMEKTS